MKKSSETEFSSAYFHIYNGGMSISIIKISEGNDSEFRLRIDNSTFGAAFTHDFPLPPPKGLRWIAKSFENLADYIEEESAKGHNSISPFETIQTKDGESKL